MNLSSLCEFVFTLAFFKITPEFAFSDISVILFAGDILQNKTKDSE